MNPSKTVFRLIAYLALCSYVFAVPEALAINSLTLLPKDLGNVREYFSANPENRLAVRVNMWGDVPAAGVYYIPDNTTLLDLIGFAGGPVGALSKSTIKLSRINPSKEKNANPFQGLDIGGPELVSDSYRNLLVRNGDVIYVDAPPKTDNFLRTLTIVGTITGIVTSGVALYFIFRGR